jgi:general secretion pathway protein G
MRQVAKPGGIATGAGARPRPRARAARWARGGFTLIELMVAVAIVALLASIAIPSYAEFVYKAQVARAISEVQALQSEITGFYYGTDRYPDDLAEIGRAGFLDPWGNAYRYLNIADKKPGVGALRKDRNLVPVNADYDLYSIGRDGQTATAFTSGPAQDDVVRANSGGFVGLVKNY